MNEEDGEAGGVAEGNELQRVCYARGLEGVWRNKGNCVLVHSKEGRGN